jgi:antitoxin (DNA-binding transcriptional repressor) of toxin-antitoxin stability system
MMSDSTKHALVLNGDNIEIAETGEFVAEVIPQYAPLFLSAPCMFEALARLANEAMGCEAFETQLRRVMGNTNYSLLIQRAKEARAIIAKARGETSLAQAEAPNASE